MSILNQGQYYLIDGRVQGYYICETPESKRSIFGLQDPSAILHWLKQSQIRCIRLTPHDLMAVRDSQTVVTVNRRQVQQDEIFYEMLELLLMRNKIDYDRGREEARKMEEESERRRKAAGASDSAAAGSGASDSAARIAESMPRLIEGLKLIEARIDCYL